MSFRGSKGQSLVEFALVVLTLMLLFMGAFDFGFAAYAYNTISLAAREGARTLIVCLRPDSAVRAQVKNTAVGLNLQDAQISIQHLNPDPNQGKLVNCPGGYRQHAATYTVTVTYTYTPLTLMIAQALGVSSLTLTAQSTVVVE
jgi:Flp pilus assembly protein TadG